MRENHQEALPHRGVWGIKCLSHLSYFGADYPWVPAGWSGNMKQETRCWCASGNTLASLGGFSPPSSFSSFHQGCARSVAALPEGDLLQTAPPADGKA